MKTNELIGRPLDWAVAKCECEATPSGMNSAEILLYRSRVQNATSYSAAAAIPFSTDWAQGGPIINREHIDLHHCQNGIGRYETLAKIHDRADITCKVIASAWAWHGEGPERDLIAAMRCYVTRKLGVEVDIPEELL